MPRNFKTEKERQMALKQSENIKRLMEKKGFRQVDMVNATGIARSTMSTYINAKSVIPMVALQKIADALGVSKSQIVDLDTSESISVMGVKKLPIYNNIKCEFGEIELNDPSGYLDTPFSWIGNSDHFYYEVQDDSMFGITEGSKALIHRQSVVENGDMALIAVKDEILIRRVSKNKNEITLDALLRKQIIDDRETLFSIIGKITKVIGEY
ncbi:repressor LexA [Bacillus sp. RC55]|uniref:LexA family protein n=1 Tax=unclassified Bacillus (in: firmicutes) TaxID=185979 RepID=UPI003836ED61